MALQGAVERGGGKKEKAMLYRAITLIGSILGCMIILLIAGCNTMASAKELMAGYTINQYVQAIYRAEGGDKAQYPYGIRSVNCETKEECKKICARTVKNNYVRFNDYGYREFQCFLDFLASRYAPIKSENDPKGLNKNWQKNVRYFLAKGK